MTFPTLARRCGVVLAAAGWWMASCRDFQDPDGIQSISPLLLPSPGLVVRDTMRDSTGAVAPLRVLAFTASGDTASPQPPATFVVLDTGAHVVGGLLVGDSVRSVRVVGAAAGLQTQPVTVKITLSPDTLVPADSTRHVKTFNFLASDTIVSSAELATRVLHVAGATPSGVDAVIVRYEILRAPPSNGQGATILVMNNTVASARDTTENGRAARTLRLRKVALTNAGTDSAIVRATASYRGRTIGAVQFTVVFQTP